GAGRLLATGDGVDHQLGAVRQVTGNEHAGRRRGQGLRVDLEDAGGSQGDTVGFRVQERQIRCLPDRQDHRVGRDDRPLGVVVDRVEAVLLVEDTQDATELDAGYLAGLVAKDLHWPEAVVPDQSLLVALADLDVIGRHFLPALQTAEVDLAHAGRAGSGAGRVEVGLPQDGAGDVVGDVTAADDDDAPAERRRPAQGYVTQEIDAAEYVRPIDPGNLQAARALGPHGDDHGGVIATQLLEGDLLADGRVAANLNAQRLDEANLGADKGAGQTVLRHPEWQHPRRHRLRRVDDRW